MVQLLVKQFDQVQDYIDKGVNEGAELFYGGPGKPEGLDQGYFARPTIFINVDNQMTIAQERNLWSCNVCNHL